MIEENVHSEAGGGTEKRRAKRSRLVFYLRLFDQDNGQMLGHLTDISTSGLMLVSTRLYQPGQTHRARLILPKEVAGRTELPLSLECLWCRPDSIETFYLGGYRFTAIDEAAIGLIQTLRDEFSREISQTAAEAQRPACNLTYTTGR